MIAIPRLDNIVRSLKQNNASKDNVKARVSSGRGYRLNSIIKDIKSNNRTNQITPGLNLGELNDYVVYINDESVLNPFGINSDILRTVKKETKGCSGLEPRARRLFNWFEHNIGYGKNKRRTGYSTGTEVFYNKEGVCGEMAFLYITMARGIGLKSNYVSVRRDMRNKPVHHACAGIDIKRGYILVDPAYHRFDVHHKKWHRKSDNDVIRDLYQWRRK